jgi:hypothetical protein
MTDTHAPHEGSEGPRRLDVELSRRMIGLGFDPKAPVREAENWFKRSRINRELFCEGRPGPVVIKFGATEWDMPDFDYEEHSWTINVLVELVTARFEAQTRADGRHVLPQFYIRGFLADEATDQPPTGHRVHVLIDTHDYDDNHPNDTAYIQVVHDPAPPDPEAVLVLGEGMPVLDR